MKDKKKMKLALLVIAVVLVAFAGFKLYAQQQIDRRLDAALKADGSSTPVAADGLTISGSLVPAATYSINAQVNGKIDALHVAKGDAVTAGQLLVKQNEADVKRASGQGSSSLESLQRLKIAYDAAEDAYQKNLILHNEGAISDTVLTQSKTQRDSSKLQYQAAANLVAEQVAKTYIKSPAAGVVSALMVKEGDYAAAGTPIATVVDTGSLLLSGNVEEGRLAALTVGQKVEVKVEALNKTYEGRLTYISPVAMSSGKVFPIEITVDNAQGEIKAGMTAQVNI